jgi:hypothetical protein
MAAFMAAQEQRCSSGAMHFPTKQLDNNQYNHAATNETINKGLQIHVFFNPNNSIRPALD